MNRVCIFAHYDKDNIIDDYVIYYLNALKKDFNKIIFVSDSDLPEKETEKLSSLCDYVQAYHHGEYDWGSYKFGYIIAKQNNWLFDADELLLCNDSVYGPVFSLEPIFHKMSHDDCDFWGIFENKYGLSVNVMEPHIQSWFILLKKNVLTSNLFDNFISSVRHLENKNDIIQEYEIGFTQKMSRYYKYKALYTSSKGNAVNCATTKLLEQGFPFIKTVVIRKYILNFKYVPKELVKLIKNHAKRIGSKPFMTKILKTLFWKRKMRKFLTVKNL